MTKIYGYDHQRIFTGEVKEVSVRDPIPPGYTPLEPPKGKKKVHIFDGVKWFTRDKRPEPVQIEPSKISHWGDFIDALDFNDQVSMEVYFETPEGKAASRLVAKNAPINHRAHERPISSIKDILGEEKVVALIGEEERHEEFE